MAAACQLTAAGAAAGCMHAAAAVRWRLHATRPPQLRLALHVRSRPRPLLASLLSPLGCSYRHPYRHSYRPQDNLHETPVYGGWLDAKGPRYCPSIEDKIVRFADKESHQVRRCRAVAEGSPAGACPAQAATDVTQTLSPVRGGAAAGVGGVATRLVAAGGAHTHHACLGCLQVFLEPESRSTPELYVQVWAQRHWAVQRSAAAAQPACRLAVRLRCLTALPRPLAPLC